MMDPILKDLRYCLRQLRSNPTFAMAAVLSLALGIGANTAIFSVVYGVLLAPLPYRDASRLMVLNEQTPRIGSVSVSYPNFQDWRAQAKSFSQMAFVEQDGWNLVGGAQPELAVGEDVSPNYLSVLGVRPILGRDFAASEEKAGTARVALMSYTMWQSHFGGDPNIVGKTITLDGKSCTIIGVLPAGLRSINKVDLMIPIGVWATGNDDAALRSSRGDSVVVGRLAPGVSVEQARTEIVGIARRLEIQYPLDNDTFTAELAPIRAYFSSDLRPVVLVLAAAVIFVLLIACANVANLLLMRGAGRSREIALRIALGAGRGRVIAQMLTESFVLAVIGGVVGVGLAYELVPALGRLIPTRLLNGAEVELNPAVLLFSAGVVILSAMIFGLAPAARLTQPDVQESLKESGRSTSASAHQAKLRDVLAIAEVAVALVLLTGAGLMLKSFYRLLAVDPGFRSERLLTLKISLSGPRYQKGAPIIEFWQQALERARAIPGVDSVAVGTVVPMTASHDRTDITVEGMAKPSPGNYPHPDWHVVSGNYGTVLGMKLERGRWLEDRDDDRTMPVGMINRRLAQKYFPGTDPIGKRFMFGHANREKDPKWITIVGVVGDTSLYGLQNPSRLEVYQPYRQAARDTMTILVKSAIDPAALTASIRAAVAQVDKDEPIFAISTMDELVKKSVASERLTLMLLGLFGTVALVLASIGIYGVISYAVTQRTHEIGVRVALGASRGDVLKMVLGHGGKIAGIGVVAGLAASFAFTRLLEKLLYSVSATDPITLGLAGVALIVVAMVACYIPARRTLEVDPVTALRYE